MTSDDDGWDRFIDGVRAGDPEALRKLVDRYGPSLERVATRAIDPAMLRRFGPESVVNSVCRTFIRRARGDEFDLPDADGLWRLLCAIALNKVRERVRYHRRERRRLSRETGVDAADRLVRAADGDPTPDETAMFRDQLERVIASLDDEERSVLELRIAGHTEESVAAELACSERTVRRVLRRLESRLTLAFQG